MMSSILSHKSKSVYMKSIGTVVASSRVELAIAQLLFGLCALLT